MTENEIKNASEVQSTPEPAAAAPVAEAGQEVGSPASLTFSDDLVGRFQEALDGEDKATYRQWGLALYHSIPDEKAHAEASKLGLEPRGALGHYNVGCTQASAGNFKDACGAFEKSLELDPSFFEAKYNLALAKEEAGDAEAARVLWAEALELADEEEGTAIRQHITEISA